MLNNNSNLGFGEPQPLQYSVTPMSHSFMGSTINYVSNLEMSKIFDSALGRMKINKGLKLQKSSKNKESGKNKEDATVVKSIKKMRSRSRVLGRGRKKKYSLNKLIQVCKIAETSENSRKALKKQTNYIDLTADPLTKRSKYQS